MKEKRTVRRLLVPFSYDRKKITKGDGRLYQDCTLLNEGEFVDSIVQVPAYYSGDELKKAAISWNNKSKYHDLDEDRTYVDLDHKVYEVLARIGYVANVHYSDKALKGDIFLHLLTRPSKDTKILIDAGYINHLSVEITTHDKYSAKDSMVFAEDINLLGVAVVTVGADPNATVHK